MRDIIAPSLMCCDWMRMGEEIRILEEAGADVLHFDMMDTTFTGGTMFPMHLLPQVKKFTKLPMDIHLMTMNTANYLNQLLPYCENAYITVHVESDQQSYWVLNELRENGAHVGLALNIATPVEAALNYLPMLDMIMLINGVAGSFLRRDIDELMCTRIAKAREMLDNAGRDEAWVGVDGNISIKNARAARAAGANDFVLGTSSIYNQPCGVKDALQKFRHAIKEEGL